MKLAVLFPEGVDSDRSPSANNKSRREKAWRLYYANMADFILCVGGSQMKVLEEGAMFNSMAQANAAWIGNKMLIAAQNVAYRSLSMKITDNLRKDAVPFIKENDPKRIYLVSGTMHLARIWWSAIWLLGPRYWHRIKMVSSGWEENSPIKLAKELICLAITIVDPWGVWLWALPGLYRHKSRLSTGR